MSSRKREECLPLKTLDDVLKWNPSEASDWSELVQPLRERSDVCAKATIRCDDSCTSTALLKTENVPKTLVCHDMKGGYLEDRFVEGSEQYNSYRFFRWAYIDSFVYFSHFLVTIPPLGWINAGHCHGVPVLGTLITEGKDGRMLWEKVLNDDELSSAFVTNLALICVNYSFDGYLINIENSLNPLDAFKLVTFVKNLKSLLSDLKPDSLLIWYDAITLPSGQLKWQNRLNNYNYPFFDICNGIFLNYNWNEQDLLKSVFNARNRKYDVYVGVDVFGRGCYGNGGFNTCMAVDMIRKYDLSVALFAPGWVHENLPQDGIFLDYDFKFWTLIGPYLYLHGISELPLVTSFCQGYGKKEYRDGKVISDEPWYNLSKQNYQPTDLHGHYQGKMDYCLQHTTIDAYNGGGSLLALSCTTIKHIHRLFLCQYKLLSNEVFVVKTVTKCTKMNPDSELVLILNVEDDSNNQRKILLQGEEIRNSYDRICDGEVVLPENDCGVSADTWKERKFMISPGQSTIFEIGFYVIGGSNILLGQLSIDKMTK